MTEENQKKLYDHFVATGQHERAQEVLKVYPHFAPDAPEEKPTKSKKGK